MQLTALVDEEEGESPFAQFHHSDTMDNSKTTKSIHEDFRAFSMREEVSKHHSDSTISTISTDSTDSTNPRRSTPNHLSKSDSPSNQPVLQETARYSSHSIHSSTTPSHPSGVTSTNSSAFYSLASSLDYILQHKPTRSRFGDSRRKRQQEERKRKEKMMMKEKMQKAMEGVSSEEDQEGDDMHGGVEKSEKSQTYSQDIYSKQVLFPPDHVDHSKVMKVMSKIHAVHDRLFRAFTPVLKDSLSRYSNLSAILHRPENLKELYTPEEISTLARLQGRAKVLESIRINTMCVGRRRRKNEEELEQRYGLFSSLVTHTATAPACDGCEISPSISYPVLNMPARKHVLLRGFCGNQEMKEVYDTHHYSFPSKAEQAAFHVTGICVTTYVFIWFDLIQI